ncbi:hypothetical protein ACFUN7_32330 [Streptomyces sp. NPDC057236]|uniref:hypothetical protein n=1 Tax=Streptomyces sp. NPDC057236 TaxID=3346059 RepID=UPI003643F18D
MAPCPHLLCRGQVCGLLVGRQSGDGLDGVAHVFAAAEVAGQSTPVLQVGDAVLDWGERTQPSRGMWLKSPRAP